MSETIKKETPSTTPVAPPPAPTQPAGPTNVLATLRASLRNDLGVLPVVVTLVVIALFFQITSDGSFFKPQNLSNLLLQTVTTGMLAVAATLVLLLGEIDLSLAAVSGVGAAVMGVLVSPAVEGASRGVGLNPWIAILGALLMGALIGLFNGFFIAVLRVPAFIVTLSGSIGFAGLLLIVLGPNSTLKIADSTINSLATTYLPSFLGIGLAVVGLVIFIGSMVLNRQARQKLGLKTKTTTQLAVQSGLAIVVVGGVVISLQSYNGVPLAVVILISVVILFWLILTRTSFGRHVYAVGGNAEASRRAGINVTGLKIAVFVLASTLAAASGILEGSRQQSAPAAVNPTLLLNAIAASVIGGVSLIGGRGSVWAIVLGSLVVKSLENGLTLLNQTQDVVEIVQGAVLLFAVTLDAVLRRGSAVRR